MIPGDTQEWILLLLGLVAGYYVVKHFLVSGGQPA